MKIPGQEKKTAHELREKDRFMLIPVEGNDTPMFEVLKHREGDNWNVIIHAKVLVIPYKQEKKAGEPLLTPRKKMIFQGSELEVGQETEIVLQRDQLVMIIDRNYEKEMFKRFSKCISKTICKKGNVFIEYLFPEKSKFWNMQIKFGIRMQLALRKLAITKIESEPGRIAGFLNFLPGHPEYEGDPQKGFLPIKAVQIADNLNEREKAISWQILAHFSKASSEIKLEEADGMLQFSTRLSGTTQLEWSEEKINIQNELRKRFIQVDEESFDEPMISDLFTGFIIRSPDAEQQIIDKHEGHEIVIPPYPIIEPYNE